MESLDESRFACAACRLEELAKLLPCPECAKAQDDLDGYVEGKEERAYLPQGCTVKDEGREGGKAAKEAGAEGNPCRFAQDVPAGGKLNDKPEEQAS